MLDVGWYRTTIRSFEREIFNIPNSVFSRNVVLNVTRKNKEWRFYEFIGEAVQQAVAVSCDGLTWMLGWGGLTAEFCWGHYMGCLTEVALCSFAHIESLHFVCMPSEAVCNAGNACTCAPA